MTKDKPSKLNDLPDYFKILDVQEKERMRISRELHDSSLQNLTHLIHELELVSMYMDKDIVSAKLELATCTNNLKEIIDEIRDTIFDLRPMSFDDLGFKECIENYIDVLKQQVQGCTIFYEIDNLNYDTKNNNNSIYHLILVTIYRIIQEAVSNALKHSGANRIDLKVENLDKDYIVEISDNGKGFSVETVEKNNDKHFGISIMRERVFLLNGEIEIISKLNSGTHIKIKIPK